MIDITLAELAKIVQKQFPKKIITFQTRETDINDTYVDEKLADVIQKLISLFIKSFYTTTITVDFETSEKYSNTINNFTFMIWDEIISLEINTSFEYNEQKVQKQNQKFLGNIQKLLNYFHQFLSNTDIKFGIFFFIFSPTSMVLNLENTENPNLHFSISKEIVITNKFFNLINKMYVLYKKILQKGVNVKFNLYVEFSENTLFLKLEFPWYVITYRFQLTNEVQDAEKHLDFLIDLIDNNYTAKFKQYATNIKQIGFDIQVLCDKASNSSNYNTEAYPSFNITIANNSEELIVSLLSSITNLFFFIDKLYRSLCQIVKPKTINYLQAKFKTEIVINEQKDIDELIKTTHEMLSKCSWHRFLLRMQKYASECFSE